MGHSVLSVVGHMSDMSTLEWNHITGGGIQLLSSGGGSSSSKLANCQWVGPPIATPYTGFEVAVNGGDVLLDSCTAIRGAIGINVIQGQTIIIRRCSLNKQLTATPNSGITGYSSASQFQTAGIRISTTAYKQAVSIKECYIEACQNSVYVDACESLTIGDNLFDDGGVCGFKGNGNSQIYLGSAAANNVSIKNNRHISASNGTVTNPFYPFIFNDAHNVIWENNYISIAGDYTGTYKLTTSTTVVESNNTVINTAGSAVPDSDPNGLLKRVVTGKIESVWTAITYFDPWTNAGGSAAYKRDNFGRVIFRNYVGGGVAGSVMFNLPVGFRPLAQESFIVNATGSVGVVTAFTNGNVTFVSGDGTYVYLSDISFATI